MANLDSTIVNGRLLATEKVVSPVSSIGETTTKNVLPIATTTYSIGSSSFKFKDLYLSGNLSDGTNTISIANILNKNLISDWAKATTKPSYDVSEIVKSSVDYTLANYRIIDAYTKTQTDSAISTAISPINTSITNINTTLSNKANKATTLQGYDISDAYTKTDVDTFITNINTEIGKKATSANSLSGYGITDTYTITQIDTKITSINTTLSNKADKATTLQGYAIGDAYTKTECVNTFLSKTADQSASGSLTLSKNTSGGAGYSLNVPNGAIQSGSNTQVNYTGFFSTRKCANDPGDANKINQTGFFVNSDGTAKFSHRRDASSTTTPSLKDDSAIIFDAEKLIYQTTGKRGSSSTTLLNYDILTSKDLDINSVVKKSDTYYKKSTVGLVNLFKPEMLQNDEDNGLTFYKELSDGSVVISLDHTKRDYELTGFENAINSLRTAYGDLYIYVRYIRSYKRYTYKTPSDYTNKELFYLDTSGWINARDYFIRFPVEPSTSIYLGTNGTEDIDDIQLKIIITTTDAEDLTLDDELQETPEIPKYGVGDQVFQYNVMPSLPDLDMFVKGSYFCIDINYMDNCIMPFVRKFSSEAGGGYKFYIAMYRNNKKKKKWTHPSDTYKDSFGVTHYDPIFSVTNNDNGEEYKRFSNADSSLQTIWPVEEFRKKVMCKPDKGIYLGYAIQSVWKLLRIVFRSPDYWTSLVLGTVYDASDIRVSGSKHHGSHCYTTVNNIITKDDITNTYVPKQKWNYYEFGFRLVAIKNNELCLGNLSKFILKPTMPISGKFIKDQDSLYKLYESNLLDDSLSFSKSSATLSEDTGFESIIGPYKLESV